MAIATATTIPQSGSVERCYSTGPCHEHNFGHRVKCDACPCCRDTCDNANSCISCQKKQSTSLMPRIHESSNFLSLFSSICSGESPETSNSSQNTYTMCQLKRHNHADSAWILVGDTIYDATPYIRSHPGGTATILRKSGGAADCTEDMRFHSGRAQREWRKFKVGTLVACPRQSSS
jgi:cytochrome b involved in lipid metabolism